jgi:hypothetical protein
VDRVRAGSSPDPIPPMLPMVGRSEVPVVVDDTDANSPTQSGAGRTGVSGWRGRI